MNRHTVHEGNHILKSFSSVVMFILIFLILVIVFSSSLCFDYLYHDDVFFWLKYENGSLKHLTFENNMVLGRYAAALLIDLQGMYVHKITDLKILRLLAVILLSGNAYMLLGTMRRLSWSYIQAFLAVLAISFLPGFADGVFYTSNVYVIFSVFFASWSFCRARKGQEFLVPSIILLVAIMFYPSGAMFYWTLVGMSVLFVRDRFDTNFRRELFRFTTIGLTSLASYAILIYFMSFYYSYRVFNAYNPYNIVLDWSGKLNWFFHVPILNALNLWCIFPKWSTVMFIVYFIFSAVLIAMIRAFKEYNYHHHLIRALTCLWQFIFFIFILFLTFMPNLAAQLNAPFYRCLVPLSSLIFFVLIWAIDQWTKVIPRAAGEMVLIVLLSIAVVYGGIKTFNNVLFYRVLPSLVEWDTFKIMAQEGPIKNGGPIYIVSPDHIPGLERYDEFGTLTSQFPEDIFPLLIASFREEGRQDRKILSMVYFSPPQQKDIFRMNLFIFRKSPGGKWLFKKIGNDNPFQEFGPVPVSGPRSLEARDSFQIDPNYADIHLQQNRPYYLNQKINADVFLKQEHPYIMNLRQIFSLPDYFELITGNSLEKS